MLKIINFLLAIFFCCSCTSVKRVDRFNDKDIVLNLEVYNENNTLNAKLKCSNISDKTIKIAKFYLSLSAKDVSKNIDERKFKSNWLEIRRPDGSKVHYFGIYCRPDYYSLENNVFIMRKNSDFVIDIRDIYYNYYFVPGEMVIIKYNGPLGESNEIECKIGNILPYE